MNEIMKKIGNIAILCAVLLPLFSCHEKPVPVPPEPEGPQPESRTLTFVLPDFTVGEGEEVPASVKTAWKAGDQIVVHGEYAKDQVTVTLAAGDISGDGKSATVTVDGQEISLTPREFELLLYVAQNKNIALSRQQILSAVWNFDYYGDARTVDTHIKNLRMKLGDHGSALKTVRGRGYKLEG